MQPTILIPTLHCSRYWMSCYTMLASLSANDWNKAIVARLWAVKDIAAHLLDGNVRGIAALNKVILHSKVI